MDSEPRAARNGNPYRIKEELTCSKSCLAAQGLEACRDALCSRLYVARPSIRPCRTTPSETSRQQRPRRGSMTSATRSIKSRETEQSASKKRGGSGSVLSCAARITALVSDTCPCGAVARIVQQFFQLGIKLHQRDRHTHHVERGVVMAKKRNMYGNLVRV